MEKVVVIIEGGCLVSAYTDSRDVDLILIDCDNLKEREGTSKDDIDKLIINEVADLHEVRY